jgi:hypothetical protein
VALWHAIPSLAAIAVASAPTPAQIQKAVRAAERSSDLWATVNVCNTQSHPRELGLRGEMPGLGFSADMYMTFEVYFRARSRFRPIRTTRQQIYLGRHMGSSLHQAGVTLTFAQPAVLEGKIKFSWKRGGTTIGEIVLTTTGHHKHVDFGDPPGHSAARCTIN